MGSHISLYLALAEPTSLPPGLKIFAEFTLRMLDQRNSKHHYDKGINVSFCHFINCLVYLFIFYEDVIGPQPYISYDLSFNLAVSRWFSASSPEQGWSRFISIAYMNLTNMGYLVWDTCFVEAEVTVLAVVNALS